ncbi:MAG TPA: hypothetical protein VK911_11755 [Vicinamibacterales bacterium]|nr:hypothetical protein [Vicinamibacterales bacterium]
MKTWLRLLLLVLAVPLAASLLASVARDRWDERWSAGLRREFGAIARRSDRAVFSRHTLGALCSDPATAARVGPCRTYNRLTRVMWAGAGAGALGLLWLGVIAGGGVLALRRRPFLLRGFQPLVYITAALLVLLVIAHGLLGVQALSLSGLLAGMGFGLIVNAAGIVAILIVGLTTSRAAGVARRLREMPSMLAREVPFGEGGELRRVIAGVAGRAQAAPARRVVAGLAPAVLVSPAGLECLDGPVAGPALHFSLTLARILTIPEFEALLASQLSRTRDEEASRASRFSSAWIRLYEERARLTSARGLRAVLAFPAASWVIVLIEAFAPAAAAVWREQEAAGLRAAAAVAGAEVCGTAMVKVAAFAAAWGAASEAMIDAVAEDEQYPNASVLFAEVAAANAEPERVRVAVERATAAAGAAWPEACGGDLDRIAAAALDVRPAVPASTLLGDAGSRLEEDLSAARHLQLFRHIHQ